MSEPCELTRHMLSGRTLVTPCGDCRSCLRGRLAAAEKERDTEQRHGLSIYAEAVELQEENDALAARCADLEDALRIGVRAEPQCPNIDRGECACPGNSCGSETIHAAMKAALAAPASASVERVKAMRAELVAERALRQRAVERLRDINHPHFADSCEICDISAQADALDKAAAASEVV